MAWRPSVGVDADPRREHRPLDAAAGHDRAAGHERVDRVPDPALLVEDELRGRQRLVRGVDRPVAVVEVEDRVHRDQVGVRVVERVERPDVAPVVLVALGRPGHVVVLEVVDVRLALLDEHRDDVAAHVVLARRVHRVAAQRVQQHLGGEDVVAHRRVDLRRVVGETRGVRRLLAEGGDETAVVRGLDDSELVGQLDRLPDRGHGNARPGLDVLAHHLARVHPVDVVGAEDDDVAGLLVADQVQALVDRVGRPGEPPRAEPLLGRHGRDVVAEHRGQPPGGGDVAVQAVALVLGQDHDLAVARVHQVGQHEVDEPVDPGERHGGLGPVGRQGHQPLALSTGQDDGQDSLTLRHGAHATRYGRINACAWTC
jgi:hypothetical protein